MRRILPTLLVALVAVLACALGQAGPVAAAPVRAAGGPEVSVIARGLEIPWDIAFLPDGRALVTERGGAVRLVDAAGTLAERHVADIPVSTGGDGGLLGIAVDPRFAAGAPFVYLSLTTGGELQVQRWRLAGSTLSFEAVVIGGISTGGVHNSARVRFGPDAALYLGTGDAGDANRSQDAGSPSGKILRVPPDAHRGGRVTPAQIARGLRHPQGLAWQPGTGALWVTDHGPSGFDGPSGDDELDLIVGGGDYGWPRARGADQSPFISPVHLWSQTIAPASITFVTQPGSTWTGRALVAALLGQQLRLLDIRGGRVVADEPLLVKAYGRLRAVVEAPDGSIWVTTSNRDALGTPGPEDDRIVRIVPPAAPAPPPPVTPPTRTAPARCASPPSIGATIARGRGPLGRRVARSRFIAERALRRARAARSIVAGRPVARVCGGRAPRIIATRRQVALTRRIAETAIRIEAGLSARLAGRRAPALRPFTPVRVRGGTPATARQVRALERVTRVALRRATSLQKRVSPR